MSIGLVLLTDRSLRWCSGGRKGPVLLARKEIASATWDSYADAAELSVELLAGGRSVFSSIEPAEVAEAIATALTPEPAPRDPLDALLVREPDETASLLLGRQLDRVRGLLHDGERPTAYAVALRRTNVGALVVTDRRLLWAAKKGEPIAVERERILTVARRDERFKVSRVEVELAGEETVRFDAIEPAERTELIVAALESKPT